MAHVAEDNLDEDAPIFEQLPVWLVTWGTCAALIPARTKDDAVDVAEIRDRRKAPGRYPQMFRARRAVERDRERFREALTEGAR